MRIEQEVIIKAPEQRAIDALAAAVPVLSRQALKQAMKKGAVWIKKSKGAKRLRRATKVLNPPQVLQLFYDDKLLAKTPPQPELIADHQAYTVWNKPAGLLAQGSPFGDHCSLLRYAEQFFTPPRESFLVHRLDADAAGLMLIAHTAKAAANLSAQFANNTIVKRYQVVVEGKLNQTTTINSSLNGKKALTTIESIIKCDEISSKLLVNIASGRKHQIRRHLAGIGHPVVGDKKYGAKVLEKPLQLFAVELIFNCPVNNTQQHFSLEPPI